MSYEHIGVEIADKVATVEIQKGPNNFFDVALLNGLADIFSSWDNSDEVRAIVLCSEGKHFCAGNDFSQRNNAEDPNRQWEQPNPLYAAATRLFATTTPVIAAIQGAAVGGGFGLAVMPDFRVACPEARFTANFVKLGFHPGFGLTHTLPRLIGEQAAHTLFLTGRRIGGEEAYRLGLVDVLTDKDNLRNAARELALELAENAPLAVQSVRATMRSDLAAAVKAQTDHENAEQYRLGKTADHREGVRAVAERRPGNFTGT